MYGTSTYGAAAYGSAGSAYTPPVVTPDPDPVGGQASGTIDATKVPTSRRVVFEGSKRVVSFEGSIRTVRF